MSDEMVYTVQELAVRLKVNEQTIRKMARRGDIACLRVAGRYRFTAEAVVEFLKQSIKAQGAS